MLTLFADFLIAGALLIPAALTFTVVVLTFTDDVPDAEAWVVVPRQRDDGVAAPELGIHVVAGSPMAHRAVASTGPVSSATSEQPAGIVEP
jgi:hypothetical protein